MTCPFREKITTDVGDSEQDWPGSGNRAEDGQS